MIEYYMNEEKRTIVARLQIEETGEVFIGKSKCDPKDKWDPIVGETVARLKALRKFYKSERQEALAQYITAKGLVKKAEDFLKSRIARIQQVEKNLQYFK